jgi:hypothetical protein
MKCFKYMDDALNYSFIDYDDDDEAGDDEIDLASECGSLDETRYSFIDLDEDSDGEESGAELGHRNVIDDISNGDEDDSEDWLCADEDANIDSGDDGLERVSSRSPTTSDAERSCVESVSETRTIDCILDLEADQHGSQTQCQYAHSLQACVPGSSLSRTTVDK